MRQAAELPTEGDRDLTPNDAARMVHAKFLCKGMPINAIDVFQRVPRSEKPSWSEINEILGSDARTVFRSVESRATPAIIKHRQVIPGNVRHELPKPALPDRRECFSSIYAVARSVQQRDTRASGTVCRLSEGLLDRAGLMGPDHVNPGWTKVPQGTGMLVGGMQDRAPVLRDTQVAIGGDLAQEQED